MFFFQRIPPRPPAKRSIDPRRQRMRMVREQIQARGIADPAVLAAMASVPRHLFVQEALAVHAYEDASLPIGYGQTISQPYVVARMTELLAVKRGMRILDVGTGSGYQAAILSAMGATVYGVERLRALFLQTQALFRALGIRGIHLHLGDGTLGLPHIAPFDRIIVAAGGPTVPDPLLSQLADNGIMLIPVGDRPGRQRLLRICKVGNRFYSEDAGPAGFVDLVGDYGWWI